MTQDRQSIVTSPRMKDGDDVGNFVASFEGLLRQERFPRDRWRYALIFSLSQTARDLVAEVIHNEDSTFIEIRQKLQERSGTTATAAAETFFKAGAEVFGKLDPTKLVVTMDRWLNKVAEGATSLKEGLEKIVVARVLTEMTLESKKQFVNDPPTSKEELISLLHRWDGITGDYKTPFWRGRLEKTSNGQGERRVDDCYHCGKPGP